MMNFDQTLFFNTYNTLLSEKSFSEIFHHVFIPLLNEIGLLWQTNTITPAHEHFVSYMIKQKLLVNTEKIQMHEPTNHDRVFVLYLPENEIHELGLMFLNYEIILNGYKSIYLGENVPISNLKDVQKYFSNITFVSYWTVEPNPAITSEYIKTFEQEILSDPNSELWLLGKILSTTDENLFPPRTSLFYSLDDFVKKL